MNPCLIYLRPLNTSTGARVDVRLGDGPNADVYGTAGAVWEPAIARRPSMSIELMSPDMDGRVQAGQARFEVSLRELRLIANPLSLYWKGASVVIHSTGVLEGASAVPDFWGNVTSVSFDIDTGRLGITAEVNTAFIDKPLLVKEFTGGGGAGGDPEKRGLLYPAGWGKNTDIQPVWFDSVRNIGMIEGYGNTISIDWLGEGLSSFGQPFAIYDSYQALADAIDNKSVVPGRWAGAIVPGGPSYVGLGAPPEGVITVNATFGANRIGAMMKRLLLIHAAVAADRVDQASFDIIDAALPYPTHWWTAEQGNVKALLEQMAQSCNSTPLVTFQNRVCLTRAVLSGNLGGTLDRSGSVEPRVLDWKNADSDPPYYLLKARAARPASVLTTDQVNYKDTLEDRGLYNAATVYRVGNLVWLTDGSQWLYQNETPAAGHYPPADGVPDANGNVSDAWWFRRQPARPNVDFAYADGTPIEALKPAQYGATVGAVAGSNLKDSGGSVLGDTAIKNVGITIGAGGQLSGAGGGQVTINGLGYNGDLNATFGASWTLNLSGRPGNLAGLAGGEFILNTQITIGSNGAISGAGGGQVTYSGIGGGALGLLANLDLAGSYAVGTLPTARASSGLINANLSIASNGALSGGGGGQVTIGGLGYGGDLNATFGASWSFNITNRPSNIAGLAGQELILNAQLSISASGALAGGGGGQVTLPGLGAGGLATKDKVSGADFDIFYNGQGGRVEIDGNGLRVYSNSGRLRVKIGF